MSQWIVRNVVLSFGTWAIATFGLISCLEVLVFGRFEPTAYVGSVIGLTIAFTFAVPLLPLRSHET